MHKIDVSVYRQFTDLPFEKFEKMNYAVYVVNHDWEYMYINKFAEEHLGRKRLELVGKDMWVVYPELAVDTAFISLRQNTEAGMQTNVLTNSPVKQKRLNIVGQPLRDCYFFAVSVLPMKEELLENLRLQLKMRNVY